MLVTVTFLDQWRSVGSRVGNGNVFGSIEVSWAPLLVFQGGFMVFHGFWLVSMFFQGGFMVYHGFWLVSMVLLIENTTKLYPGITIQSRPCRL